MEEGSCRVEEGGMRLDRFLAARTPGRSRARWQADIRAGHVTVNGEPADPDRRLRAGDEVAWRLPPEEPPEEPRPEAIPLDLLYEDDAILVLNKPPGLVVHPGAGNPDGTLLNALLHHAPETALLPRAGLVHRLDKDTSGLLVVAKTESARLDLQRQFKARETKKEYLALVKGIPPDRGVIEEPIGRHPVHRKKMTVRRDGRPALSRYEVVERFARAALVRVQIETGRTHQIRVHMAHIGHPVLGDPLYGGARGTDAPRQMLHAAALSFSHPHSGERLSFSAPLPDDMVAVLERMRSERDDE